jgi:hypothetical protein
VSAPKKHNKRQKLARVQHIPYHGTASGWLFYYCGVFHSVDEVDAVPDGLAPCRRCEAIRQNRIDQGLDVPPVTAVRAFMELLAQGLR